MSDKRKESSFSKTSKSYSRERREGREFPKAKSEQASERSERSEKSVRSASKKSINSPPEHKLSRSVEHRKAVKLPIHIIIDSDYFEKLSRDDFELFDKIKAKYALETIKVDDSIAVPDLRGRVVSLNAAIDDDKYEAAEYFAERYIKSTDEYKDSSSNIALKLLMPENVVSLFIGAKGKHIKQLMYDTKTKIVVSQPNQTTQFRSLTIQGDVYYVKRSLKTVSGALERLATDKQFNSNNNHEHKSKPVESRNSRVLAKIIVEDEIVSYLYNKRENIIRNIIKDYNVGIKVIEPQRNLNLKRDDRICVS